MGYFFAKFKMAETSSDYEPNFRKK